MNTKFFLALAGILLVSGPALAVSKDAATDDRGSAVRSTNGKCVRTKWDFESDICAPKPVVAPEPEPAPPPAVVEKAPEPPKTKLAKELSKDETSVYFDFDKADLSAKEQGQLDEVAEVLKSDKEVESVKIVAYADRMGSTEYNDKLSQKRAQAVNDYLNSHGYLKTTVAETAWLGETAPKTSCPEKMKRAEKIACLQEDRRADIVINYYNVVEVPVETPTVPAADAPKADAPTTSPDAAEPKSGTPAETPATPDAKASDGSASNAPATDAPAAATPDSSATAADPATTPAQ